MLRGACPEEMRGRNDMFWIFESTFRLLGPSTGVIETL